MPTERRGRANDSAPLQAAIGWTALGTVLIASLALGANRPVSWLLLSTVLLALFAVQTGLDLFGRRPPAPATGRLALPSLLWLGVVAWGFAQTVPGLTPADWAHPAWAALAAFPELGEGARPTVSADPEGGRHHVLRLSAYAAAFWIALRAAQDPQRARAMIRAVALFSAALAAFGLFAWSAGWNPILGETWTNRGVVQGSFVNRNSYATYAAFGALANLAALALATGRDGGASAEDDPRRSLRDMLEGFFSGGWIFALGALMCFAAVILTQSRAGAGAAIAGTAVFLAAWRRRGDREGAALIAAAAAILLFIAAVLSSGLATRMLAAGTEELRFVVYPLIVEQAQERPWLGHGLGAFHEVFRAKVPLEGTAGEWDLAHNAYLENLHELGGPATAALYLALALIVGRLAIGAATRRRDRLPSCLALGAVATAAVHSLVDFSLQMPAAAALFAVLLGMGWAQSFSRRPRGGAIETSGETP